MSRSSTSKPPLEGGAEPAASRPSAAPGFQPFVDGAVLSVKSGDDMIEIESTDRAIVIDAFEVAVTIRKDRVSLERMRVVSQALAKIVDALEALDLEKALPEKVEPEPPRVVLGRNPF